MSKRETQNSVLKTKKEAVQTGSLFFVYKKYREAPQYFSYFQWIIVLFSFTAPVHKHSQRGFEQPIIRRSTARKGANCPNIRQLGTDAAQGCVARVCRSRGALNFGQRMSCFVAWWAAYTAAVQRCFLGCPCGRLRTGSVKERFYLQRVSFDTKIKF